MATNGIERIDLLKLDVEGSELDALEGRCERKSDVGVIIGGAHETCVDVTEFYSFLDEHGFQLCWKRYFREGREQHVHGFEAKQTSLVG